jgi:ParB family chromosome partitioning protein
MMFSIMENGLFNPIIIWERDSGSYMILSGHNRVNAFKRIREEYQDDEFNKIPSIIYKKDEIDEKKAQEIIIDTNYIQREEDLSILPLIVKHRKEYIEKQKDRKGNTLMMVAQELNIGRTRAFKLGKIATDIIPELAELYYNKVLTQDNALKFSWYNKGVQKKIYDKYGDKINNETVNALKKDMSEAEIRQVFNRGKGEKISNILFKVPEDEAEDLREFVMEYLSVDMDKRKDIKKAMTYYLLMSNEDIKRHLDMLGEKKGVRL